MMPRVLMASDERLASAPAEGPPAPAPPSPESSASSPPKASTSSPPPPAPSPPQAPPPPPPATKAPSPPAPSGHSHSPTTPFEQSTVKTPPAESAASHPPETSPAASPPPPASPPPSPPPTSRSPPPSPSTSPPPPQSSPPEAPSASTPPSPTASTPPSHQSPPESTTPPPSSSEKSTPATSTPSPSTNATASSKPPAEAGTPSPPHEKPTPGTPSVTTAQAPPVPRTPSSSPQFLPPPMAVTVIMPASGTPAGTWQSSPGPPATASPLAPPARGSGGNVKTEVLIVVSVAGLLLALASLFIFVCFNSRGKKRHAQPSRKSNIVVPERVVSPDVYQLSNGPAPSPSGTNSYDFSGSKSWFTYDELVRITGGFSAGNVIGEGGFGKVYMGALGDGRRVAVKQLKVGSGQGEKEFRAEVDIISRIHHRHLVTLVSYCVTENHRLLVYEFVPNKTLEHHLHGKGLLVMDWPKRMKIAIGSARGLTYLHEDCHPRIIHRDIKSANILLDDAFDAKVADFGLAKLTNDSLTHISTRVMGTFGYMAPEYASSGKLTDRSDVFSFGVVLLELITGRKPVDASQPLGEESLVEWARLLLVDALETNDYREIADPALEGRYSKTEMRRMVEAAAACVRHSAAKRPRMVQVWRSLDVDGSSSDLTNGVKLGHSTAYDSSQYSADIELFRRMAFANDLSTAESGFSDEDDHHGSTSEQQLRTPRGICPSS
ncbi:proline-rich receptor-like protein kinase PERK8 [Phragmites australis]|uniref:proline-rich receptor-like protein kinase PERK8 n=1 Tax=Phragmites australis TaxID=29695 RepID=UPI002D77520B|nr:proline-rich receptor-like protein kinase PERK8 [Phragmites australis]